MPPPLLRRLVSLAHTARDAANVNPTFAAQRASWKSPDNILDILMLIGGDIVQRAVAQLAGTGPGPFCPTAFSFGWLAYSVSALTSAVGDGRLLPRPETPVYVVNAKSGYTRENASWVLYRLLRDRETKFKRGALTVAFYHTCASGGTPSRDWVYWSGVLVILAQLAIAAIPGALNGDWMVLVVTAGGTLLALMTAGLPQWRDEKYAARPVSGKKDQREVVVLTRGNGSTFAMVVVSDRVGLRLEDLAGGRDKRRIVTSVLTGTLALLWIVLLLTVEGMQGDAWYLLAVGGLGMVQNVIAAGATRSAEALGFHFHKQLEIIKEKKVMKTLKLAEEREPGVGLALLPLFFPGDLWPQEREYWDDRKKEKDRLEAERRERIMRGEVKMEKNGATAEAHVVPQLPVSGHRRNDTAVTFVEDAMLPARGANGRPSELRRDTFSTIVSEPDSMMSR